MDRNELREPQRCDSCPACGLVKLYAQGKIGLLFEGPVAHRRAAEECFKRALNISITVDEILFVREMRDCGTPEKAIRAFLDGCMLIDEVRLDTTGFDS